MKRHEFSGKGWLVVFGSDAIQCVCNSISFTHDRLETTRLRVQRKWFRYSLLRDGEPLAVLSRCRKAEALALTAWLQYWELLPDLDDSVRWREEVEALLASRLEQRRWIPLEEVNQIKSHCPARDLRDQSRSHGCESLLTAEQLEGAIFAATDLEVRVQVANEQVIESELIERRAFFNSIERTPLSEEQARAVVCFDNRVQVLAAAGSGKTSVMVAKAAYAVDRCFVPPDRVLLLAFNRAAASELQERVEPRFAAAGIPSEGVKASTFHAFGLEVIGRATGEAAARTSAGTRG